MLCTVHTGFRNGSFLEGPSSDMCITLACGVLGPLDWASVMTL